MEAKFENPFLTEEAISYLSAFVEILPEHRIDISEPIPVLISTYSLTFKQAPHLVFIPSKNETGSACTDYYYNGLHVLHISENEQENWISTTNLKRAAKLAQKESAAESTNYLDSLKHQEYDKMLRGQLLQLAMLLASDEYNYKHVPILIRLKELKNEDKQRHDKIVNSDPIYKELFKLMPNWSGSNESLDTIRAKDSGAGISSVVANTPSSIASVYTVDKFELQIRELEPAIPDSPRKNAITNKEVQNKGALVRELQKYIARIESHTIGTTIDYQHKFWVLKESRGDNREANYILARHLVEQLLYNTDLTIHEIFSDLENTRSDLFLKNSLRDDFKDRGINSTQLNGIIRMAHKFDPTPKNSPSI